MRCSIRKITGIVPLLLLCFILDRSEAAELSIKGLENGVRQGDVVFLSVKSESELDSLSGEFRGKILYFKGTGGGIFTALFGVGMEEKPGRYELLISGKNSVEKTMQSIGFEIRKRKYKVERLTLPSNMVTPDKSVIDRIIRENNALKNVKKIINSERLWKGDFIMPAKGTLADNFGARRILNGKKKNPHSGVDIRAYAGTKVRSPNRGKVIYVEEMYYGGKTVVIDHGHGLSTLYMHLSKIFVNHGEEVEKGEVIGLVGSTGRATGPHLHWGAYFYGQKVDPASLLRLDINEQLKDINFVSETGEKLSAEDLGG